MAFTLNRRLSTLVNSSGQINTGKIPNDYIGSDHIADNVITTAMLHSGFTLPTSSLSSIDTDNVSEGSSNLYFTNARVDSRLSGGTGVTYSSGAISIGQAVATTDNVTFADLTVTGDLTITGDINSYNVTDLDVADKTITLGAGQVEANSGGSGIVIDGSNASILWDETNDQFDFNKGINVDSNTLVVDGTNNRVGILNAAPDVSLDLGSATDGIHMPVGTTAQRPSSPAAGYFRYNSTDGQFEGYTTEWGAIAGSGGASAMETNNFTGDGSTTGFTLSSTVSSEDNLIVFIEGIYQNKGDYVASGTTLTFTTAPVSGRRIVVQHILSSVAGNSTLYTSLTGDGSTTAFTLSGAPGHENNTQVFMDGVYQQKDSYIVSGTTLTFDAAPANNAEIEVMSFAQTTINAPGSNTVSVAELNLSDGTAGQFITTDGSGTISFATVNGTTINNNADNRIITGSGTANTLNGEANLTYDGTSLSIGGTGSITIPVGTTAQRPGSPANGMVRYNTTKSTVEGYISGQWQELQSQGYPYTLEYVVVAGGGAGGTGAFGDAAGGAGGGGYRSSVSGESSGRGASAESAMTVNPTTVYTITVGAGGSNAVGGNSSISGSGLTTITSNGGGEGADRQGSNTVDGGCGGGGAYLNTAAGSGTTGQGYDGGTYSGNPYVPGGAGGGAGGTASGSDNEIGGAGVATSITGSSATYALGGHGGNTTNGASPVAGGANTGTGGGGYYGSSGHGGNGGSGIVILKVLTANYSGTTTGSPTVTTSGDYKIIKFTGSGTYTG